MNNIEIDTSKLETEINKIIITNNLLKKLLEELQSDTNFLKDYWQTDVSESVYTSFEQFYKDYQKTIENIEGDISFLEKIVNKSYEIEDSNISKAVDEKLH